MSRKIPKTAAERHIEAFRDRWPGLVEAEADAMRRIRAERPEGEVTREEYLYAAAVGAMVLSGKPLDEIERDVKDPFKRCDVVNPEDVDLDIAWSTCRHVFRFDAALASELASQDMPGKVPVEALERLPYIVQFVEAPVEVPTTAACAWKAKGFFVWRESWRGRDRMVFKFLLDGGDVSEIAFDMDGKESLGDFLAEVKSNLASLPDGGAPAWAEGADESFERCWAGIFNMMLYLNAENADTEVIYRASGASRKRKASQATVHAVGSRVGPALGEARAAYAGGEGRGSGAKKAPHVRRAHWATFWVGPRKGREDGKRGDRVVLKWIGPVEVGFGSGKAPVGETVHEARFRP